MQITVFALIVTLLSPQWAMAFTPTQTNAARCEQAKARYQELSEYRTRVEMIKATTEVSATKWMTINFSIERMLAADFEKLQKDLSNFCSSESISDTQLNALYQEYFIVADKKR